MRFAKLQLSRLNKVPITYFIALISPVITYMMYSFLYLIYSLRNANIRLMRQLLVSDPTSGVRMMLEDNRFAAEWRGVFETTLGPLFWDYFLY